MATLNPISRQEYLELILNPQYADDFPVALLDDNSPYHKKFNNMILDGEALAFMIEQTLLMQQYIQAKENKAEREVLRKKMERKVLAEQEREMNYYSQQRQRQMMVEFVSSIKSMDAPALQKTIANLNKFIAKATQLQQNLNQRIMTLQAAQTAISQAIQAATNQFLASVGDVQVTNIRGEVININLADIHNRTIVDPTNGTTRRETDVERLERIISKMIPITTTSEPSVDVTTMKSDEVIKKAEELTTEENFSIPDAPVVPPAVTRFRNAGKSVVAAHHFADAMGVLGKAACLDKDQDVKVDTVDVGKTILDLMKNNQSVRAELKRIGKKLEADIKELNINDKENPNATYFNHQANNMDKAIDNFINLYEANNQVKAITNQIKNANQVRNIASELMNQAAPDSDYSNQNTL